MASIEERIAGLEARVASVESAFAESTTAINAFGEQLSRYTASVDELAATMEKSMSEAVALKNAFIDQGRRVDRLRETFEKLSVTFNKAIRRAR